MMPTPAPRPHKIRKPKTPEQRRHYGALHQRLKPLLHQKYPLCQICGKAFATDAAHLTYPAVKLEDYASLCAQCHRDFDAGRAYLPGGQVQQRPVVGDPTQE